MLSWPHKPGVYKIEERPPGEIGELFSRGPMMFSGYYKAPNLTKKTAF